jgi:hypothetical protein
VFVTVDLGGRELYSGPHELQPGVIGAIER